MQIYPSILEKNTDEFFENFNSVIPLFEHVQIDISDTVFVSAQTVQVKQILEGFESGKCPHNLTRKTCEFHLMVQDFKQALEPIVAIQKYIAVKRVIVHCGPLHAWVEAHVNSPSEESVSKRLTDQFGLNFAVTLSPNDSVEDHIDVIRQFKTVQLMTVHPGKQGQPLQEKALDTIAELRELDYTGEIILDGAMNDQTIHTVLQRDHWPSAICPGSYFKEETENRLNVLQNIVREYEEKRAAEV